MKKIIAAVPLIVYLLSFPASILSAQTQQFHELHIYPGVGSTPLILPWLTQQQNDRLTVVTPPTLGTISGGKYSPLPGFWEAGGDRMSLKVAGVANPLIYTIFLTALIPDLHITQLPQSVADFEYCPNSTCLPFNWTEQDPQNLVTIDSANPLSGERSLAFWLPTGGTVGYVEETPLPLHGGGGTGAQGTGEHRVEPPDSYVNLGTAVIASLGEIEIQIQFPLRTSGFSYSVNGYFMRVAAPNNTSCTPCETPWRTVPYGTRVEYNIWAGDKVTGPDDGTAHPKGLRFTVQAEGQLATIDRLDGKFNASGLQLGVLDSNGVTGLAGMYDNFVTWRELYTYVPLGNILDGFEGGMRGDWVVQGPSQVTSSAAISGQEGLDIRLQDLITRDGVEDAVLIDQSPSGARSVSSFMRLDTSSLSMGNGTMMRVLLASESNDPASGHQLALVLRRWAHQYWVQLVAIDDNSWIHATSWVALTDSVADLAVQWRAADSGDNNGEIRLWESGSLVGEKLGINNSSQSIESVAFGVSNLVISGEFRASSGMLHLDDLASFTTY